jgi:glucokinase
MYHADEITSEIVIKEALENKDELCLKAVKKFIEILSVEAGNFALKTLPYGGTFICGNVAANLTEIIQKDSYFMSVYLDSKGSFFGKIMGGFPIFLLKKDI